MKESKICFIPTFGIDGHVIEAKIFSFSLSSGFKRLKLRFPVACFSTSSTLKQSL
jgi:hypothetical protein